MDDDKFTISGYYRMRAVRPDGTERLVADWFPNLITDYGLNKIGTAAAGGWCLVGSGSTAPAVTDTSLVAFVASTNTTVAGGSSGVQSSAPYYAKNVTVFQFAAGVAAGNLSEVGIGSANTNTALFSRALILDVGGSPTTITILSDEILKVDYETRVYPPTVDATPVVINIGGTDYTFTSRAARVTDPGYWAGSGAMNAVNYSSSFGTPLAQVYNGTMGAITSSPSGSSTSFGSASMDAYSNNSYTRKFNWGCGISEGNVAGGITAMQMQTTLGTFQVGVSPAIPKDSTKTFQYSANISWARRSIP